MSDFISQAKQPCAASEMDWLNQLRNRGEQVWRGQQLPTRKTENWKYTNLKTLEAENYFSSGAHRPNVADLLSFDYSIANLDAITLVFVNGFFHAGLSKLTALPQGLHIARFAEAEGEDVRIIDSKLNSLVEMAKHPFASLNTSQLTDGVFVKVAKHCKLDRPIQVVWLSTPQGQAFSYSQRLFLLMEPGSEATLIEHFTSDSQIQNSFANGITELTLQKGAQLRHYRLHLEEENAIHIGGIHAWLHADAVLDSFNLALGGKLKRLDIVVNHRGEGAHCGLNGIYLPRNKQHVDFHTTIEHAVPRCTTSENFRGIISDRARAVFNGRIHIHRDAQKTSAQLSNKNLLTSHSAEVDTKPELEIYADDVQCSHGATVAQLDEKSIHYLRSRGISAEHARVMLSFGFINQLINDLKDPAVAEYVRPKLAGLFALPPQLLDQLV